MWETLYSRSGHRWQYRACALHARYLRLQIHTPNTLTLIPFPLQQLLQERFSVLGLYVYCLSCYGGIHSMWAGRNETSTVGHWIKITLLHSMQVWVLIVLTSVIYGYDWSTSRPTQLTACKRPPDHLDYEAEWTSEPVRVLKDERNVLPCRKSKNSIHAKLF